MSKRTLFTSITPLPNGLSREAAIAFLHDHVQMIDLNPLIQERHRIPPPPHSPDEELACTWYSLTDKVAYLPGGLASGSVTYTCAFHDLARGLQTHCYAPMGVETRSKWSIGGSMPGEPVEPVELGLGAPTMGLYLREDVDLRCNILMASFVKKTIKKSHATLVDRLSEAARKHARSGAAGNTNNTSNNRPLPHQNHTSHVSTSSSHQQDMYSSSRTRKPSTSQHQYNPSKDSFTDRPLPPTPPVELEDGILGQTSSISSSQSRPAAAELQ